ncbi:MAG: Unknown protein [uncultured Sulfurovum sp.]|uniref:Uncharacterized protein n=1 Tax=uncultured Sulfurovum sp. TaxID=269237 RepID=A0A6S6RVE4_9BACT|nr:MAG: Unknown protein [uncultured Sulfurovum sp.]
MKTIHIKGENMSRLNLMIWSAFVLILQSGCIGGGSTPTPVINTGGETTQKVGIGIEKGKIENYPTSVQGLYYYGQVVIEPQLTMEALKGPEAQTFLSHISNLLGEEKRNFGLSATPIIDGKVQPDIVLFNYSYNSSTKEWVTYLNEEPRTRMVLLKPDTTLSFELKYISVDGKTFNSIKDITKDLYGATVLVSGVSIPYVDLITEKISNMLSSAVSSTTVLSFNPVSNPKKSVKYFIKTKANKKLANVKFSLLLRDSVVSGAVVNSELNKIPQVNNFTNPLNAVYTSYTNAFTLNDQLQKDESIVTFSQINNPMQFRDKCQNIINRLETYGLNLFDRYNAFSQILEGTNFLRKENLYHSGCLSSSRLALLNRMGIPLKAPQSAHQHIEISDSHLTNLGGYMLNPIANKGFKSDLLKLFSETLIVQSDELMDFETFRSEDGEALMSPENFMEMIGEVGVARFGLYNQQRKEYASFFFRALQSDTIYRIKLNRERKWGKIRTVLIEPWSDDEIAPKKQAQLRTLADETVLGYENDVMRQNNEPVIALNG